MLIMFFQQTGVFDCRDAQTDRSAASSTARVQPASTTAKLSNRYYDVIRKAVCAAQHEHIG